MSTSKKMSPSDSTLIKEIAERVKALYASHGNEPMTVDVEFVLRVCHATVCPLRLFAMLHATDVDLAHDINGIFKYMDAESGKMRDCFQPRFAQS